MFFMLNIQLLYIEFQLRYHFRMLPRSFFSFKATLFIVADEPQLGLFD